MPYLLPRCIRDKAPLLSRARFLNDSNLPWWNVEYRVLLTEKNGGKHIVIKQKAGMRGETNVSYHDFDMTAENRLKETLDEILRGG